MTPRTSLLLRCGLFALLAIVAAGVGTGLWWSSRQPVAAARADIPEVDLSDSPAAVAAFVRQSTAAVAESPEDGETWGRLGMVLFAHQWELEAAQCFEQAAQLDTGDARWPYLQALCTMSVDIDRAIELLRHAVAIDHTIGAAHARLGELLLERGDVTAAEQSLQTAHELDPLALRPLTALARVAQLQQDHARAVRLAEEAADLAPDRRVVLELLASVRRSHGDEAGAADSLRMAAALPDAPLEWDDPLATEVVQLRRDTEWRVQQAGQLLADGNYAAGIDLLRNILQSDPTEPHVFCMLARAYLEVQETAAAEEVLQDAMERFPESAEVRFHRGVGYFVVEDFLSARRAFAEAVELKPDDALTWFNLGQTLERLNLPADALAAYQSAVAAQPSLIEGQLCVARLLLEAGDRPAARQYVENALRIAPDHPGAQVLWAEHFPATSGE